MATYKINIDCMAFYQLLSIEPCTWHRILRCDSFEYPYKTNSVILLVMTGTERGTWETTPVLTHCSLMNSLNLFSSLTQGQTDVVSSKVAEPFLTLGDLTSGT